MHCIICKCIYNLQFRCGKTTNLEMIRWSVSHQNGDHITRIHNIIYQCYKYWVMAIILINDWSADRLRFHRFTTPNSTYIVNSTYVLIVHIKTHFSKYSSCMMSFWEYVFDTYLCKYICLLPGKEIVKLNFTKKLVKYRNRIKIIIHKVIQFHEFFFF